MQGCPWGAQGSLSFHNTDGIAAGAVAWWQREVVVYPCLVHGGWSALKASWKIQRTTSQQRGFAQEWVNLGVEGVVVEGAFRKFM